MRLDRVALAPVRAAARSGRGIITGEAGRALEEAFQGPLPEEIGRSLVENHVLERLVESMAEAARSEGIDAERIKYAIDRAWQDPALKEWAAGDDARRLGTELAHRLVETAAFKQALRDVLASPEVRAALTSQASGFGDDLAAALRRRSRKADQRAETRARHLVGRPPTAESAAFGGFASRGVGLVVDVALAELAFVLVAGAIALVAGLAGGLHTGPLAAALAGAGWFVAAGIYFVAFWSIVGQTPGMRLVGVRVVTAAGTPPSALRALVRFAGLILAIVPLFAGFLPALFDGRRRALQDYLSGTVVLDTAR